MMLAVLGVSVLLNVALVLVLLYARMWRTYIDGAAGTTGAVERPKFRRFLVVRDEDVSGVSGEGVVCEGVEFSDGHAAIHWLGKYPMTTPHHEGVKTVREIHGHEGKTRLVWIGPS